VNLRNFFAALKRLNVHKVAIAYAVVGPLVVQISAIISFAVIAAGLFALRLVGTARWAVRTNVADMD
jgi:hypothetical protein